jgi:hypothetical protein
MPDAGKAQTKSLASRGLNGASRVPGFTLGRVSGEIGSIWTEARALSRGRLLPTSERKELSADVVYAGWYAGLATMATLRMIEWQMAAVIAGVHTVERYGRRKTVRELAAGLESGI